MSRPFENNSVEGVKKVLFALSMDYSSLNRDVKNTSDEVAHGWNLAFPFAQYIPRSKKDRRHKNRPNGLFSDLIQKTDDGSRFLMGGHFNDDYNYVYEGGLRTCNSLGYSIKDTQENTTATKPFVSKHGPGLGGNLPPIALQKSLKLERHTDLSHLMASRLKPDILLDKITIEQSLFLHNLPGDNIPPFQFSFSQDACVKGTKGMNLRPRQQPFLWCGQNSLPQVTKQTFLNRKRKQHKLFDWSTVHKSPATFLREGSICPQMSFSRLLQSSSVVFSSKKSNLK